MKGRFFVIDGLGGLGKSTQIEMLKKRLGSKAVFSHEPGGTPHAEKLRTFVRSVDTEGDPHPLMDFFVFWAARADHVNKKILPALKKGKTVVCDRFDSSTFAMQVRGDKNKDLEKLFWQCREHVLKEHEPDAYIIIDGSPVFARSRRHGRGDGEDRFDEKVEAYQKRIRAGYLEFAKHIGKKGHVVKADQTQDEVHTDIWKIVDKVLKSQ